MYYDSIKREYGELNDKLVDFAYKFLFSHNPNHVSYDEFLKYVNNEFNRLGCVVLWKGVKSPYSHLIGKKEIIITDECLKISSNYELAPTESLRVS